MQLEEYLKEIRNIKLLERNEEQALWRKFKDEDDENARRILIESYQPLVFGQAAPYFARENVMDIIQEGTVGLIEAAEGYDYKTGVAFSLYAVHRIRGRMLSFLAKENRADTPCMDEVQGNGFTMTECLADDAPPVYEVAEVHQLTGEVLGALKRLPGNERAVLEGIYLDNMEIKSVADAMEVSTSHIYRLQKKGIRRARGMLAKFMHGWKNS